MAVTRILVSDFVPARLDVLSGLAEEEVPALVHAVTRDAAVDLALGHDLFVRSVLGPEPVARIWIVPSVFRRLG